MEKTQPQTIPIQKDQIPLKPEETLQTQDMKTFDCKKCKFPIKDSYYFCPNCGKKLKEQPFKFSIGKSVGLIIMSLLLPPIGLIPGIKHLFKKEKSAKILGIVLILISLITTYVVMMYLVSTTNKMFSIYNDLYYMQTGAQKPINDPKQNLTPKNVLNQIEAIKNMSR